VKYHVLVNGNHHQVSLQREGSGFRVQLGDQSQHVDVAVLRDGEAYSLLVDGRSIDVGVDQREQRVELLISGRRYPTEVLGEREWLARSIEQDRGQGEKHVRAAMTGIVREVLVAPGDPVRSGQVLLILEAMKMENEVKAEVDGVVGVVRIEAGATVELGALLIEIE